MLISKIYLHILTFCLLALIQAPGVLSGHRIVGGKPSHISHMRHLVQLWHKKKFICGGTLVSDRYVVTAAHCVKKFKKRNLHIVAGSTYISHPHVKSKISKVTIPNNYDKPTYNMDVAVLRLTKSVKGRNIKPIKLCGKQWKGGATVTVSGWGYQKENKHKVADQVRTVTLKAISHKECSRTFSRMLTKSMACAYSRNKDACKGDSGGTAVINGKFCGVVSWGIGCGRPYLPGIYTDVYKVKKFIRDAMKNKKCRK